MGETPGYLHAIDGRIRVKVPRVKGSLAFVSFVEETLEGLEGVHKVSANPTTGNVLVLFDQNVLLPDRIMEKIKEMGGFDIPAAVEESRSNVGMPTSTPFASWGRDATSPVAHKILTLAVEAALERLLVALI